MRTEKRALVAEDWVAGDLSTARGTVDSPLVIVSMT
jgi:hypothetical protein